jgi:hypothetical protein
MTNTLALSEIMIWTDSNERRRFRNSQWREIALTSSGTPDQQANELSSCFMSEQHNRDRKFWVESLGTTLRLFHVTTILQEDASQR